jgi:hypothetical protein
MRNLASQYNFVLVQAIMCSFSVIQGVRVEISTDASDGNPKFKKRHFGMGKT